MRVDFCAVNIFKCCNSNSTCTLLRFALFWYITQPLGCPETSVRNYQSTLH